VKLVRLAVATALGASALVGVQANAAPKPPPCKIVTDAAGDATLLPGAGPTSNSLDITSADVASDKKRITVVIRVKKLATSDPAFSPTGQRWNFTFTADTQELTFTALTDPTGKPTFQASYLDPVQGGSIYGGGVTGVLDLAKNEIRMTAELDLFAAQATIKAGTKLTELGADAGAIIAVPDLAGLFGGGSLLTLNPPANDSAESTKTYVAGSKTCVTVNK
jgi:hypothetical protein